MIYIASILGYGDSLITCSLLERAGHAAADVQIVGTSITKATVTLLRSPPRIADELFRDVAAFHAIKSRGVLAALRDLMRFRQWTDMTLSPRDTLILETQGLRNRLLVPRGICTVVEVYRSRGAYVDREMALRPYIGKLPWQPAAVPKRTAQRVAVNPSSRARQRTMPTNAIEALLRAAKTVGTEVCLIDATGRFEALHHRVHTYLRAPTLQEASIALRNSDRYVGPDSFFIHLAYYYKIPFFTIYQVADTYFAPPGSIEQGHFSLSSHRARGEHLVDKLTRFLSADK